MSTSIYLTSMDKVADLIGRGIPIELGAHQCKCENSHASIGVSHMCITGILVRNNVVRDELKSRLGKIGAIL